MKKLFKIIFTTIKVIFVLLVVFFAGFIFLQRFSNNNISIFGYRMFAVATGSMEPVYHVGDVILCKDVDYKTLKEGDDITYLGTTGSVKDKVITHRIIKIDEYDGELIFHTKGVASVSNDPAIKGEQIYGKVVGKVMLLSIFHKYASTSTGIFIFVIVPLMLLIGTEIIQSMLERKQKSFNVAEQEGSEIEKLEKELLETQRLVKEKELAKELELLKQQVALKNSNNDQNNNVDQVVVSPEAVENSVSTEKIVPDNTNTVQEEVNMPVDVSSVEVASENVSDNVQEEVNMPVDVSSVEVASENVSDNVQEGVLGEQDVNMPIDVSSVEVTSENVLDNVQEVDSTVTLEMSPVSAKKIEDIENKAEKVENLDDEIL